MGKVTLEFDSVEEADDIRNALDGYKWKLAIWDLDQHLREQVKYNSNLPGEVGNAFEDLREKIRSILYDYQLQME
jgi:hypothetical protein